MNRSSKVGGAGVQAQNPDKPDVRFSDKRRLRIATEFSQVFSARQVLRGEFFNLHYLADRPAAVDAGARLGLVVAKKLARRAVQRNLLKRLAREAFRQSHAHLPAYDLVLRLSVPLKDSRSAAMRQVWRTDIDRLLQRLAGLAQRQPRSQPYRQGQQHPQQMET